MSSSTKVTVSDCGRALNGIEQDIGRLELEKVTIQRRIDALRTQGLMISQLVKML